MALIADKQVGPDSPYFPSRLRNYNEIYIGHTPTINFQSILPIKALNVVNVDTGAAFTGKLSAIDVHTKKFFKVTL